MKERQTWKITILHVLNTHFLTDNIHVSMYKVCIVRIDWPDPCLETSVLKLTLHYKIKETQELIWKSEGLLGR